MAELVGLLVMAYGTASGLEDVERYYTDIRGGRAPGPDALKDLKARYAAIGNRSPLADITREQAARLEQKLNAANEDTRFRSYVGYKHASPFVADVAREMAADGIHRAVGIVMAPHYSRMSIGSYIERVEGARPQDLDVDVIESWHDHPTFLDVLASRVESALHAVPPEERDRALVVFTAHSLPTRILEWGDPYP
ncbi:MAG: ferrochelatase, partial [Actinomycetota bacterium]